MGDVIETDLSEMSEGQLAEYLAGWRAPECPRCGWWSPEPVQFAFAEEPLNRGQSDAHFWLKDRSEEWLRARGFKATFERAYFLSPAMDLGRGRRQGLVRIDVVKVRRGRDVVAVECGECHRAKLEALTCAFREVWHWPYGADEPVQVRAPSPPLRLRFRREPQAARAAIPEREPDAWSSAPRCPGCGEHLEPAE